MGISITLSVPSPIKDDMKEPNKLIVYKDKDVKHIDGHSSGNALLTNKLVASHHHYVNQVTHVGIKKVRHSNTPSNEPSLKYNIELKPLRYNPNDNSRTNATIGVDLSTTIQKKNITFPSSTNDRNSEEKSTTKSDISRYSADRNHQRSRTNAEDITEDIIIHGMVRPPDYLELKTNYKINTSTRTPNIPKDANVILPI